MGRLRCPRPNRVAALGDSGRDDGEGADGLVGWKFWVPGPTEGDSPGSGLRYPAAVGDDGDHGQEHRRQRIVAGDRGDATSRYAPAFSRKAESNGEGEVAKTRARPAAVRVSSARTARGRATGVGRSARSTPVARNVVARPARVSTPITGPRVVLATWPGPRTQRSPRPAAAGRGTVRSRSPGKAWGPRLPFASPIRIPVVALARGRRPRARVSVGRVRRARCGKGPRRAATATPAAMAVPRMRPRRGIPTGVDVGATSSSVDSDHGGDLTAQRMRGHLFLRPHAAYPPRVDP